MRPSPFLPSAYRFHIQHFADSTHGVSVPLVPPSSAASVPLAPPAGIAAPAHPPAPSSASAAFSPPSEGNRGAPPPHRFHIGHPPCGKERMVGEVKKGRGLFPVGRLHVGGPALGEAEPAALRGASPRAPGHIAGSLRQPSAQRFMHATQHRPNASSSMRAPLCVDKSIRPSADPPSGSIYERLDGG